MMNPLLIFDGNCQAQHLAAMFDSTNVLDAIIGGDDWGFLPAHRGHVAPLMQSEAESRAIADAKARGARVIQVSQYSPFSKQSRARSELDGIDARVFFPEVRLWAISSRRFREAFHADYDIPRILDLDIASVRKSQEKAGFPTDVAAFVEKEIRNRPLFHTVNHPNGGVFACILNGLSIQLQNEFDTNEIIELARSVEGKEGLNFETDHPVSASDRRAGKFEWGATYEIYIEMLSEMRSKNWHFENADRYEQFFSGDTQYWKYRALFAMDSKDEGIGVPALEKLVELCPGVALPWIMYARFFSMMRKKDRIQSLLERAEMVLGDTAVKHAVAARLRLLLREISEAEIHAREYRRMAPRNVQSVLPLIQILTIEGKHNEARAVVREERGRKSVDRITLKRFLGKLKDDGALLKYMEEEASPIADLVNA